MISWVHEYIPREGMYVEVHFGDLVCQGEIRSTSPSGGLFITGMARDRSGRLKQVFQFAGPFDPNNSIVYFDRHGRVERDTTTRAPAREAAHS